MPLWASGQVVFNTVDSLLQYISARSSKLRAGDIRVEQAKRERLANVLRIFDPTGQASLTYTNNLRLPVYLFPAEVFGGQPGTFEQLRAGTKYTTNGNLYLDVKLINPQGIANARMTTASLEAAKADRILSRRQFSEDVAATFYNIVSIYAQMEAMKKNAIAADTLFSIARNKFKAGVINEQELNEAEINSREANESVRQAQFTLAQQYSALKILTDLPESDSIEIAYRLDSAEVNADKTATIDQTYINSYRAAAERSFHQYRAQRFSHLPAFSFFMSYTEQQFNNNSRLFDSRVDWITSSYIGFKLSIPLPSANSVTQVTQSRFNYWLAMNDAEHAVTEAANNARKLTLDLKKSQSQYESNAKIFRLRKENYEKNLLNYNAGITDIYPTLDSFNKMVDSEYQLINSAIDVLLNDFRIDLNNKSNL